MFLTVECIFIAKWFSLGNLSLLTNFQKLSNSLYYHYYCTLLLKGVMLVLIKIT